MTARLPWITAFWLAVVMTAWSLTVDPARGLERFETGKLVVATSDGARHAFTVELARTPAQRAQGLMYRRALARDRGMLFIYPRVQDIAMWMKNTYIPLDMLFIAPDGRIVKIVERTVPHSLRTIGSGQPVKAVLELAGGSSERLGIAPGDRVLHEAFGRGD